MIPEAFFALHGMRDGIQALGFVPRNRGRGVSYLDGDIVRVCSFTFGWFFVASCEGISPTEHDTLSSSELATHYRQMPHLLMCMQMNVLI